MKSCSISIVLLFIGCNHEIENVDAAVDLSQPIEIDAAIEPPMDFAVDVEPDLAMGDLAIDPCHDGQREADETDVDCGGPRCAHCPTPKHCRVDEDCLTGLCENGTCVNPHALTLGFGPPQTCTTAMGPRNVAVGDWNGDKKLDVAAPSDRGSITVCLGIGDGTFGNVTSIASPQETEDLWAADFNVDGKLDFAVKYWDPSSVGVLLNKGGGAFGNAVVTPTPNALDTATFAVGDLDDDGRPDIFIPDWDQSGAFVLLGDGKGGFTVKPSWKDPLSPATRVRLVDINGDGHRDALLANAEAMGIWLGDGKGGFAQPGNAPWFPLGGGAFTSLGVWDFKRDGVIDVVDSWGSVFMGKGNGTFAAATSVPSPQQDGRGMALADFDRDGQVDAVVGQEMGGSLFVYRGTGPGTFMAPKKFDVMGLLSTQTIVAADLNGDDLPDLVVSDWYGSQIVALLNQSK